MPQHRFARLILILLLSVSLYTAVSRAQASGSLGLFESQSDVGSVTPPGTATYDAAPCTFTLPATGPHLLSRRHITRPRPLFNQLYNLLQSSYNSPEHQSNFYTT